MSFWSGKRVLVTGASGFVGSALFRTLDDLGATVFGTTSHTQKKDTRIHPVQIEHFRQVDDLVRGLRIDTCFHLAGASLVEAGQKDPYHTFKTNTMGTLNILEVSRKYRLRRLIITSTAHVYGKQKPPIAETAIPLPSRPYETSKLCADTLAQSYAQTYDVSVAIPRFANIYGPGDMHKNRLIPSIFDQIIHQNAVQIWGGTAVRDYLYIDDAIQAYLLLGEVPDTTLREQRVWNFGGSEPVSVRTVAEMCLSVANTSAPLTVAPPQRENEIEKLYLSSQKAQAVLGWEPQVRLAEGLKRAYTWYNQMAEQQNK